MKATKHEVVKLIVEMARDNEEMTRSILGNAVVNAAKESMTVPVNLFDLKQNFLSGIFILEQIEAIDYVLNRMRLDQSIECCQLGKQFKSMKFQEIERQRAKYIESLQKVTAKI